ncbi:MAG: cation:proton antiporter [Hyalangium sp.]|uniref:cation:proton antiporter n=1 Tax=Hyalangium sp. TaxID=2028555 RepID=UPI00389A9C2B
MSVHQWSVALLLGLAVLITLLSSVGVLVMKDPYQRLHYIGPPTTVGAILINLAVFLDEPQKVAGLKMLLTTVVLITMNGVITHATARAARIRELGRLSVEPSERIPLVGQQGFVGQAEDSRPGGEA